jgi:hypothetical protein
MPVPVLPIDPLPFPFLLTVPVPVVLPVVWVPIALVPVLPPVFPRVVPVLVPVFPCPIPVEFPDLPPIVEEWDIVEGREVEGRLTDGRGALTCGEGADLGAEEVFLC